MSLATRGLGGKKTATHKVSLATRGLGGYGAAGPPPDVEKSSIGGEEISEKFPISGISSVYQLHRRLV